MRAHPHSFRLRQPVCGFTLVELLVVIVIIATLAALSLIGFRRMRASADKVTATGNIAQLQIANTTYAADHNGQYMPVYAFNSTGSSSGGWHANATFLGYIAGEDGVIKSSKNANTVPLNLLDPVVVRARKFDYESYAASFGYNNSVQGSTTYGTPGGTLIRRTSQITSPERSMAFITATDWMAKYTGRFLWKGDAAVEGRDSPSAAGKIAYRHGGKALAVYFDGHVGEMTMADFEQIDKIQGSEGGKNHPFWLPTQ